MDILYKNVPDPVYQLICDKIAELSKLKKRKVNQSEAITALIKSGIRLQENTLALTKNNGEVL